MLIAPSPRTLSQSASTPPGTDGSAQTARARAEEFCAAHALESMRVLFCDMHGVLRGKILPVAEFLRSLTQGIQFSPSLFAKDVTGRTVAPIAPPFQVGGPDHVAIPDGETFGLVPWHPRMGQVIADLVWPDGTPVPYAPRTVLRRVLAMASDLGVSPSVASELEFYVVDRETQQPTQATGRSYDVSNLLHPGSFIDQALTTLTAMSLPVETVRREAGPSQFEITLRHTTPLRMADYTVFFKNALSELAWTRGLVATFMAKPFGEHAGSGFHVHQSLWDPDGTRNLFACPQGNLSTVGLHFLAGQMCHMAASTALFAPTMNSFKRLRPDTSAPMNCTWGYANRTTAIRIPDTTAPGCRIEHRVPGADANPYLVLAACLAAGLLGLREAQCPPPPVPGAARHAPAAPALPRSIDEALYALRTDEQLTQALGRDCTELFAAVKRAEADLFDREVSGLERRLYLDLA